MLPAAHQRWEYGTARIPGQISRQGAAARPPDLMFGGGRSLGGLLAVQAAQIARLAKIGVVVWIV